jgi:hypothetical protein
MIKLLIILCCLLSLQIAAQNNRQSDFNNISWIQVFVIKKIGSKTDWLSDYQLRRVDGIKNGQQNLFRTLVQYKPNEQVNVGVGYANAETFVYGDYPIANAGKFPEHRAFEQVVVKQKINAATFTSRFRMEQRWLGKVKQGTNREIEQWSLLHRFRYMAKLQAPLYKKMYAWVADEIFIGAGKNVGVNIFDQNRIHANLGYKINNKFAIEISYVNQLLQQGRLINNKAIIQRNSGIAFSTSINL